MANLFRRNNDSDEPLQSSALENSADALSVTNEDVEAACNLASPIGKKRKDQGKYK